MNIAESNNCMSNRQAARYNELFVSPTRCQVLEANNLHNHHRKNSKFYLLRSLYVIVLCDVCGNL
jgi:hypothetical protein